MHPVRRVNTDPPRSRKSGYDFLWLQYSGFFSGVAQQSALDRVPEDFFFGDVRKKIGQTRGKSSPAVRCSGTLSQIAIDRAWSNY